jgi:hypothetical protein
MSSPDDQTTQQDHLRFEISQLEKMQQQIMSDMEALRVQENNLRAYEMRLRETTPPTPLARPAGSNSRPPLGSESLDEEWEKLRRSRTLLEAERRAFTDERLALRESQADIKRREEALRQRESWVELREKELAAKSFAPPPSAQPPRPSFTRAPFAAAKNMFSLRAAS